MCFYDLEKAFDSIEYATLLSHLFELGINGKCWRLINSWYINATSVVKHNGELSQGFCVCSGVRQGSVLSPILFLVVMDVLLEQSSLGLTNSGHADDICAVSNGMEDLQCHTRMIQEFGDSNAVKLNASKTEVVKFSALPPPTESIMVAGQSLSTQPAARCMVAIEPFSSQICG